MKWLFVILSIIIVIFFGIFYFRERLMFIPSKEFFKISDGEWIEIEEYISGYHLKNSIRNGVQSSSEKNNTLILYSHGNGGNITWYTDTIYLLKNFGDVLAYDYPGYGLSKGKCTEKDILESGLIVYDYVVKLGYQKIICYGFSMGGAVSTYIASKRSQIENVDNISPSGLILQSTFSKISDCIPVIGDITMGNFFRSIDLINSVNCPIVVLHSSKDEVVPCRSSKELYDKISSKKKFIDIEGGHNTSVLNKEILTEVFNFLQ